MASSIAKDSQIPIDLFVSKKHNNLTRGDIGFADFSGCIVFSVRSPRLSSSSSASAPKRILFDATGIPLVSMYNHTHQHGSWRGFKGNGDIAADQNEENLLFRVERTAKTITRTELKIFIGKGGSTSEFRMKGCPFQKSCTIYSGDSIVAQSSLMYKLNQIFVKRSKFRVTIYPGNDHTLVAALVVIFLDAHL